MGCKGVGGHARLEADMTGVLEGCETITVPEAVVSRAMIQRPKAHHHTGSWRSAD